MAKLVSVCRSENYPFERRQIPLVVDENLTMVLQLGDSCLGCSQAGAAGLKPKDVERFRARYAALSGAEVSAALSASSDDILSLLAHLVPCVGCRRSVERLYRELAASGHPAIEPLTLSRHAQLSVRRDHLTDPAHLYTLFYVHGSRLNSVVDNIPKSKKNKRCLLHSLDTQRVKALAPWGDIWDALSNECREEVLLIDCEALMVALDNYLRKHRFCAECKSKVLRAYELLIAADTDTPPDKGYCPALYAELRCCPGEKHIHVSTQTDYIAQLIARAEPELMGSRRERHAKTLDLAQEEVLTCVGVFVHARLHAVGHKLRAETQTWTLLYLVATEALKQRFEVACEAKQGVTNLELMCAEIEEQEQQAELRRATKRQKRRRKKAANRAQGQDKCECDENTNLACAQCAACEGDHAIRASADCGAPVIESQRCQEKGCGSGDDPEGGGSGDGTAESGDCLALCECGRTSSGGGVEGVLANRSDCGYCSGADGCDCQTHTGGGTACESCQAKSHDTGNSSHDTGNSSHGSDTDIPCCHREGSAGDRGCSGEECQQKYRTSLSLADMLEASCSSGEDEDHISPEEIARFRADAASLDTARRELRATLRQRFTALCATPPRDVTVCTAATCVCSAPHHAIAQVN